MSSSPTTPMQPVAGMGIRCTALASESPVARSACRGCEAVLLVAGERRSILTRRRCRAFGCNASRLATMIDEEGFAEDIWLLPRGRPSTTPSVTSLLQLSCSLVRLGFKVLHARPGKLFRAICDIEGTPANAPFS